MVARLQEVDAVGSHQADNAVLLGEEVEVGPDDGLEHESSVHCDALVSVPKTLLSDFVGSLDPERKRSLDRALGIALGLA